MQTSTTSGTSTVATGAMTAEDLVLTGLRLSRAIRRHLTQTADGTQRSHQDPDLVLAVLAESLHWERTAREMSVRIPVELQVRYRDLVRLAAASGLKIEQLLPAE
jgi:hypothetical protein